MVLKTCEAGLRAQLAPGRSTPEAGDSRSGADAGRRAFSTRLRARERGPNRQLTLAERPGEAASSRRGHSAANASSSSSRRNRPRRSRTHVPPAAGTQAMAGQATATIPQPAVSHFCRMASRTLLSVTNSVQPELQGESDEGTCSAHWPAAPAVQLLAPINTAVYWDWRLPAGAEAAIHRRAAGSGGAARGTAAASPVGPAGAAGAAGSTGARNVRTEAGAAAVGGDAGGVERGRAKEIADWSCRRAAGRHPGILDRGERRAVRDVGRARAAGQARGDELLALAAGSDLAGLGRGDRRLIFGDQRVANRRDAPARAARGPAGPPFPAGARPASAGSGHVGGQRLVAGRRGHTRIESSKSDRMPDRRSKRRTRMPVRIPRGIRRSVRRRASKT